MFEVADSDALRTFAVDSLPIEIGDVVDATKLADHRRAYIDYEGPISNNRGAVVRYAYGAWQGKLWEPTVLLFDPDSKNFAGQTWDIQFGTEENQRLKLFRIS